MNSEKNNVAALLENNVYSFKMFNGDEIVGKFRAEFDRYYIIEKPFVLMLTPQGPQFVPMLLTTEQEEIPIAITAVAGYAATKDDARAHYTELTTGIRVQKKQIITG